ncbi:LLM class flavin-dependent oxidoreductase [Paenibacillus sp. TRM 82003]|uniref:LLM class flavin-dependent oxidoreductase n=1 Tax=Kineococcus sp. TRM81007 TaxID=2925831 RepID=UPI001F58E8C4|nr:LLM class flavin-dependent oxidoreductase [Kineococcus sp. TRM81007]MCI2240342.1 LLM class flavin-dependent oxidoreductase [Kineococcus sp. TRM81007]MCI3927481.1 LLM class flavin-dependent oxidoreductase [Paenibacillus sp. TRM 82003]
MSPAPPPVVPLSVLDLSPVPSGTPAATALRRTVELARAAERFGYHRYWLAEHHNQPSTAGSAPAVLAAAVAAATGELRVGAGGVMLPNHAPLAVAEAFRVLAALHPGRIDLGLGRAPGTDARTALALRGTRPDPGPGPGPGPDDFTERFTELLGHVDGFAPGHRLAGVRAVPDGVPLPPVWVLGSSERGATTAARLGTGYAHAGHLGTADPVALLRTYREGFRPCAHRAAPHALLTVVAIVADAEERARALLRAHELASVRARLGRPGPLPSAEEAAAHAWTPAERHVAGQLAEELDGRVVAGTAPEVARRLHALVAATGADELVVLTPVHGHAERERSYELLARAWGLAPRTAATR